MQMSTNKHKTIVVGTTNDYIAMIEEMFPRNILFITDISEKHKRTEGAIHPSYELLVDISDVGATLEMIDAYLKKTGIIGLGVACFDDESLHLSACIGQYFRLPFPTVESVGFCRDKYISKQKWIKAGLSCPDVWLYEIDEDLQELGTNLVYPNVVKPLTGSGSELVFKCDNREELDKAIGIIRQSDVINNNPAMYRNKKDHLIFETYQKGEEYSCDFIVWDKKVEILRTAKKLYDEALPLGTVLAYQIPGKISLQVDLDELTKHLYEACSVLGLSRANCMADFIIDNGAISLLEVSPRIGGDCIPHVLKAVWGIDVIQSSIEFSKGKNMLPWLKDTAPTVVGMKLYAHKKGVFKGISCKEAKADSRFIAIEITKPEGSKIILPPEDYSSWSLGYLVFQPYSYQNVLNEVKELKQKINIQIGD